MTLLPLISTFERDYPRVHVNVLLREYPRVHVNLLLFCE